MVSDDYARKCVAELLSIKRPKREIVLDITCCCLTARGVESTEVVMAEALMAVAVMAVVAELEDLATLRFERDDCANR